MAKVERDMHGTIQSSLEESLHALDISLEGLLFNHFLRGNLTFDHPIVRGKCAVDLVGRLVVNQFAFLDVAAKCSALRKSVLFLAPLSPSSRGVGFLSFMAFLPRGLRLSPRPQLSRQRREESEMEGGREGSDV